MSTIGWYYLHKNGSMIYKPSPDAIVDIRDSNLARCAWPMDQSNRAGAWDICVEGLALGADKSRVAELAEKWGCGNRDAENYAKYLGVSLSLDGDKWCATGPGFEGLQVSQAGFGGTALEALAALAKGMNLAGGTMWRATFRDLLNPKQGAKP